MSAQGDMRKLIGAASRRGWTVTQSRRKQHYRLTWIDGTKISIASTPSDHHGVRNALADLRRVEQSTLDKSKI